MAWYGPSVWMRREEEPGLRRGLRRGVALGVQSGVSFGMTFEAIFGLDGVAKGLAGTESKEKSQILLLRRCTKETRSNYREPA